MAAKQCHDRWADSNGFENLFSALWFFKAVEPKVQKINFTYPGQKSDKIKQIMKTFLKSIAYTTVFLTFASKCRKFNR